jgi:predicted PolB exonuclease-like 3'-5' exonuclease
MGPILAFDIETVPDAGSLRQAWGLSGTDDQVVEAALARRREATGGSDFLPLHLHRVIVISMLLRDGDGIHVGSLAGADDEEGRLIQGFYRRVARYTPTLVSWNGAGFDLQVLHYRGMIHKVQAPRYWDQGEEEREFRFNNYLSRYHSRHTDLMDLLALYNGRANAPLDELARLCGFPGKLGMDGSQVWPAFRAGRQDEIRDYCETDVANTWLLWCRFQLMRGALDPQAYEAELALTRRTLSGLPGRHWQEFLAAWPT